MPVIEEVAPEALAAHAPPSPPAAAPRPDASSEAPVASVIFVVDDGQRAIAANLAAVDALLVRHRWLFRQDRRADVTDADRTWTPEEKLLRAIFGDLADSVAVDGLDENGVPAVGALILRGAVVCCDPVTRERQRFTQDVDGAVVSVDVRADGLDPSLRERVEILLSSTRTLTVGDSIAVDGRVLGLVADIVDDRSPEARIYVHSRVAVAPGAARASIALPTARQRSSARESGPYDDFTRRPTHGERVLRGALQSLVERGCLALVTDFAAFKFDDRAQRTSAQQALSRGEAIEHPWRTAASNTAAPTGDIFSLFDRPRVSVRSSAALARAVVYARALAVDLCVEGQRLSLRARPDAATDSSGEVEKDLDDPRIFGSRRDDQCECGALSTTRDRGATCARCGVTVLDASAREQRFGHCSLREPFEHPASSALGATLAVVPPAYRARNDAELEAAYQRVVASRTADDARAVCSLLVQRLARTLALPEEIHVDFSGGATAIVDPTLAPDALVVPVDLVTTVGAALLCAKCEEAGLAQTVHSAKALLASDAALRRTLALWLLRTRPLLLQRDGTDGPLVSANATDVDEQPVFRVGVALGERLFAFSGDRLSAHVPLSAAAIREADWLASADEAAVLRGAAASDRSWVERLCALGEAQQAGALRALVESEAEDACEGLDAAWLIGGYALDDDAGLLDREPVECDLAAFFARGDAAVDPSTSPALDRSIDELDLSVRTLNALQSMGISTVRDLAQKTEAELLKAKRFGRRSLLEVKEVLSALGLWLGWR